MEPILSLLFGLVFALIVVGVVYWIVVKIMKASTASGTEIPPVVVTGIQILFVLVALYILFKYVPPILEALTAL